MTEQLKITNIPQFLISDIYGNQDTFFNLTHDLKLSQPKRAIHPWTDLRYDTDESVLDIKTLASKIVSGITAILPKGIPCFIAGYSFGGTLLTEIIDQLKAKEVDVYAFIIDSVTIDSSQKYFVENNLNATKDLILIFDLLAKKLGFHERDKDLQNPFSEAEIKAISSLPVREQLYRIKRKYDSHKIPPNLISEFSTTAQIVIQNYISIAEYKRDHATPCKPPNGLFTCMTRETLNKYDLSPDGNWGKFYGMPTSEYKGVEDAKVMPEVVNYSVLEGSHTELLKDGRHAKGYSNLIAKRMIDFFEMATEFHNNRKNNKEAHFKTEVKSVSPVRVHNLSSPLDLKRITPLPEASSPQLQSPLSDSPVGEDKGPPVNPRFTSSPLYLSSPDSSPPQSQSPDPELREVKTIIESRLPTSPLSPSSADSPPTGRKTAEAKIMITLDEAGDSKSRRFFRSKTPDNQSKSSHGPGGKWTYQSKKVAPGNHPFFESKPRVVGNPDKIRKNKKGLSVLV